MANLKRPKTKIRKDDTVVVTAGDDKGRTGRVLKVLPYEGKILVEGINMVRRAVKKTANEQGHYREREAPVHISNVALWNEAEKRRMRVGWKVLEDGTRVRFDRKNQQQIDKP